MKANNCNNCAFGCWYNSNQPCQDCKCFSNWQENDCGCCRGTNAIEWPLGEVPNVQE